MLILFIFLSANLIESSTVQSPDEMITPPLLTLTEVGPLSASFSATIEYRDLIYISLSIQGNKDFHKTINTVLDSTSSMCYLKSGAMGLSVVANPICSTAIYGCGESFQMSIGLMEVSDPQVNYDCMLLNLSQSKHEGILGLNLIGRPIQQVLTLIPLSPSEIKFSSEFSSAEYTVSTGRITLKHLNEDQDCIGDIATVNFYTSHKKITRISFVNMIIASSSSDYSIIETVVIVTFDTTLAQSEYSSKFLDLMADFEYLQWSEKGPKSFIIERRNLKMFADGNAPYLRIGVDILRNLAISFDANAVYFCQPKYTLPIIGIKGVSYEELHGIKVDVQRSDHIFLEEDVNILIKYDVTVQVEMMVNNILIFLQMDTGSDLIIIPKLYTNSCQKGDSSFYCSFIDEREFVGSKTVFSLSFPTRQKYLIKPKQFKVIGGINANSLYDFNGMIGLQYKDNSMDSLPYIWNVEWMVFIPEVINPMEVDDDSTIRFPNGRGLGRLVLTNDFHRMGDARVLCEGDNILNFPADRSSWDVKEFKIEFIYNGHKQVIILDKVLIDTGFTMSQLGSSRLIDEINEAAEIKIVSPDGKSLSLSKEKNLPFFSSTFDSDRNIIGVNILRRLITGFRMFPSQEFNNIGEVIFCIPRIIGYQRNYLKKEIYQSEINKMTQILKDKGLKDGEYECQNVAGFNIYREVLQNSWQIDQGMILPIDWDNVKEKVSAWVPWTLCFQDFASYSIDSRTAVSRVILDSILQNTYIIPDI
jgi:hypothetical protein